MTIEYLVLARSDQIGDVIYLSDFPGLKITYLGFTNRVTANSTGQNEKLSITMNVSGTIITIASTDTQKGKTARIINSGFEYIIQGVKSLIFNKSYDQTYLGFRITKIPDNMYKYLVLPF